MEVKPTKMFYLGCFVIAVFSIYIGSFINLGYSILLAFIGVTAFIDLELINILAKRFGDKNNNNI